MWGDYFAGQDSSFKKDTQPFPRWHPKGERDKERGIIGDKKQIKKGSQDGTQKGKEEKRGV